jgi:glycosyltransferase involved in cell wall biosynthesis
MLLLSEYEGFGLPVLEAQAHRMPVLCSDIPVFREVLADSAYFIDTSLDEAAVRSIIGVLSDPAVLRQYARDSVVNIQRFSWKDMSAQTLGLYQRFLDPH